MMHSRVGHRNAGLAGTACGPGFWEKGSQRHWGLVQQGHQHHHPAPAKATDQAQAGGPVQSALARQCRRDIEPRPLGEALLGRPPTLSNHKVATATANHRRAARWGSVMRVRCHGHPARLVSLKPCSIQARNPYQQASLASGGKSVRINQGAM